MPLYVYKCTACGHEFESLQPMDTNTVECPLCRPFNIQRTAVRKMAVSSFRIKGHSEANGYNYQGGGKTYRS